MVGNCVIETTISIKKIRIAMYIGNSLLIVKRGCCIIKQSILEFSRRVNTMK